MPMPQPVPGAFTGQDDSDDQCVDSHRFQVNSAGHFHPDNGQLRKGYRRYLLWLQLESRPRGVYGLGSRWRVREPGWGRQGSAC
eukprot:2458612-Amphidinium_carterae.3